MPFGRGEHRVPEAVLGWVPISRGPNMDDAMSRAMLLLRARIRGLADPAKPSEEIRKRPIAAACGMSKNITTMHDDARESARARGAAASALSTSSAASTILHRR